MNNDRRSVEHNLAAQVMEKTEKVLKMKKSTPKGYSGLLAMRENSARKWERRVERRAEWMKS